MINLRPTVKSLRTVKKLISSLLLPALFLLSNNKVFGQDGKALFQTNCAQCHNPVRVVTGPALQGVTSRVPDSNLLHAWIKNNQAVLASGNKYFNNLFNQYNKTAMNLFPTLQDKDIDAILNYVETYKAPATTVDGTPNAPQNESDNTLLYGILTLILAIIMFVLLQVNASLRKLSDDKEGIPTHEAVPFYRNKVYIALAVLVVFLIGGYYLSEGAIGLGRQQGYQPVQPIFYSHRIHAGINQISCLYCHSNALVSKHATVPPLNVCMNCHAAINEYRPESPKLYREDGTEVDGTAEIQKLYSYVGYDPKTSTYHSEDAKPVEWIKIHNLPDHVFFSHAQHTAAGKVQCQTCHGPIQTMDEVHQFAPLSMGWCVNCHRTTKVDFPDSTGSNGNKFYSIYEHFQQDLKNHDKDSITVKDIGGTECQKCHY
ncbi:MAG TPA: c-type cytochrome [Puia sp.]|nr:c-type cytochrome [Puia sp.]